MNYKQGIRYNPITIRFEEVASDKIMEPKAVKVKGPSMVEKKEPSSKVLHRTMFETSRVLEYFTERELVYQTGHPRNYWPLVVLKELMDNALDGCENASIAPKIKVELYDAGSAFEIAQQFVIVVEDNGPGIDPEVITKILNFATRTSDKEAYVSPTRGAQGNALKTVFAIPYVLSDSTPQEGICQIESKGIRHIIRVRLDVIKQEPKIEHEQIEIVKTSGCRVVVWLEKIVFQGVSARASFYKFSGSIIFSIPTLHLMLKLALPSWNMRLQTPVGKSGDRMTSRARCGTALRT